MQKKVTQPYMTVGFTSMLPYPEPDNSQIIDWQFNDPCWNFLWRNFKLGIVHQLGNHIDTANG